MSELVYFGLGTTRPEVLKEKFSDFVNKKMNFVIV